MHIEYDKRATVMSKSTRRIKERSRKSYREGVDQEVRERKLPEDL